MTATSVKICGVSDFETAITAVRAGADYLGFVFFRKSSRHLSAEAAEEVILELKQSCFDEGLDLPKLVGLFVDAGEKELAEAAPLLTHFQFHGHEKPERCEEMGVEFAVDVIKAIPVARTDDIAIASEFAEAADILLFDAKPPPGAGRPGGHGIAYDWSLLKKYQGETPYFVAGGLDAENIAAAISAQNGNTAFHGVDVSSGVETAPGKKDPALIEAFVAASKKA
ncbi:MAG: phosphoribosylanthranilate isomerase [Pseudomonadota bacterium]